MSTNSPPSGRRQRLILTVLIFAQLLIWIDGTVLSTAYETLADPVRGLGATPGQLQWATGSYTLVLATVTFTGGALGDRFGHRNTLLAGMALFGLASVFAAYSQNTGQLIAARAVMGLGAALLIPATLAVISFTYPPEQRPQAFGVLSSFAGVGIAAGPVLAGLMLANFWWGSVFLINVPVVVLGLVAIARTVPNFQPPAKRGLDFPGLLLSSAGLGLLSYGLIRAGQDGTVTEPQVWITVAGGLVVTAAFVVVELRRRHPSFDPRLFRLRQFAAGNVSLTLLFLALSASGFYFAFYLQGARGYSALRASLVGIPGALGVVIGGPVAAKLARRTSVRRVSGTALTVSTITLLVFSRVGLGLPIPAYIAVSIVQATAIGMTIAPLTGAILGSLPLAQAGAGSAVNATMRQTGSVLGIALGGTILSIGYRHAIGGSVAALPAPLKQQAETSAEMARNVARHNGIPNLAHQADLAFVHAMHTGMVWSAAATGIGALLVFGAFANPRKTKTEAVTAQLEASTVVPESASA
ncbi:drug resistance transporter, EmrB/QacA subfamily [Catenulispora acidiphila DSM 44928]|uniref:Drug resistance transporter, EmrB/QacA subfamily n=1 Tax=Catenulispora acidiphila (strain DSM 44928 / JCM 14897 / NBRC 102108 / NRRL B-24433 / ID139908) TaxID=479433 RepID=C7PVC0_CATAD|nr:MFS transporter [Catenulispora acidiphila]ACU69276.1 drug resistance transporter, EmrB/QacA subfamily [Catenulispora acidiphila DSM 44928]